MPLRGPARRYTVVVGDAGESAKFWLTVVWAQATVAVCVVHLIGASVGYASKKDSTPLTQCLRPIYTAVDEPAAAAALDTLQVRWGTRYPATVRLRRRREQFVPFRRSPSDVRRVISTTSPIESIDARLAEGDPQPLDALREVDR